jgi:hypothetical protein
MPLTWFFNHKEISIAPSSGLESPCCSIDPFRNILQFTPNLQYHAISAQLQRRHIIESGMLAAVLQWPHRCM